MKPVWTSRGYFHGDSPRRYEKVHSEETSVPGLIRSKMSRMPTINRYSIPPYVHDAVSAFYYVRTLDYSKSRVGEKIFLQNFFKDSTYSLAVKFLGRQRIDVDAGTFNCILVEPLMKEGGLFKSEGRVIIWLTDDERKIPVKVSTKVVVGSIDAELREYSGINGPIGAKVR